MTLHVGMVGRCLNTEHVRGMGRYVQELLIRGAEAPGLQWTVFANDPARPLRAPVGVNLRPDVFEFRGDRFELWAQVGLPRRAHRKKVDVLHCTEGALPWWQPVPTVVTLHDTLAWAERPDDLGSRLYWDHLLPAALRRCAGVITISESSRRDIVARWPDLASKLHVIPHGIGQEYLRPSQSQLPLALQQVLRGAPYLVYLGGPMQRKRFEWAVRVLEACGLDDVHLVACGFGAMSQPQARQQVPKALRSRVHFASFLENDELVALYKSSLAVLYPTLYEGFGFPAVEAQAAGAPVLFSAVSSLAELVGPLSLVAPVDDLDAWCGLVRDASSMGDRRQALARQAVEWARRFSWDASYRHHLEVYTQIAEAGRA